MRRLLLLIAASLLSSTALAQMKGNTRQECMRRCLAADLDEITEFAIQPYNERLKKIRAEKKSETDPARRKVLDDAERDQVERRYEVHEDVSRQICAPLRDE
jgi:hypothetical protein